MGRWFAQEKWSEDDPDLTVHGGDTYPYTREAFGPLFRTLRTLQFPVRRCTIPQLA